MADVFVFSEDSKFFNDISRVLFNYNVISGFKTPPQGEVTAVFFNTPENTADTVLPVGCVGIAGEEDTVALHILKNSKAKTVTCGFSPTATVTVSSVGDKRAVVSLQRQLQTLSGNTVEEGEMNLPLPEDCGEFAAMAAAAVMLLTEHSDNACFV